MAYHVAMPFPISFLTGKMLKSMSMLAIKGPSYIDCYDPIIEPINGQNTWRPSGLPLVQPLIKRRPPDRPKKKRALELDEPRSHRKNRGLGISKQCKSCRKLGHNRRSCKGEDRWNSSLPRNASQVSRTTRRVNILL